MSIAGGLPCAVDRAVSANCAALQIFTKNASQWRARPLPDHEVRDFRRKVKAAQLVANAHNSYLINIAAAQPNLRLQSLEALAEEFDRAESLGLRGLVMHPGAYTTGAERDGLLRIVEGLTALLALRPRYRCLILLEHTAGQGTSLGHRFEHLAFVIEQMHGDKRIGVCLDSCHLVAAGYDITTDAGYELTFREFHRIVGLRRLKMFHLNDSKRPCGSRVDRHEHIGKGCLGAETFRRIVNDRRFRRLPMVIETPKSEDPAHKKLPVDPFDEENLRTLRSLLREK